MHFRNAPFHERGIGGVLLAPLKWLCAIGLLILGLIFATGIVDWIFVFNVWPDGLARLESILGDELSRTYAIECWYGDMPRIAANIANGLYGVIFRASGIHDMGERFASPELLSIPDTIVRNFYVANFEAIHVAMVATQLFGVKLAMLLTALPLLGLMYFVALIDGLVERAIRRSGGGNESATIYHRAKYLQAFAVSLPVAAWLLSPMPLEPCSIFVPTAIFVAMLGRLQWTYYKKYT